MPDSNLDDAGFDSGQAGWEAYLEQTWWETWRNGSDRSWPLAATKIVPLVKKEPN
jgi:hypothetical protein